MRVSRNNVNASSLSKVTLLFNIVESLIRALYAKASFPMAS